MHFPSLLIARIVGTIHQFISAILINMRLDMTSRNNLIAPLGEERTLYPDIITHVDQKAGYIHEHVGSGRSASRALEVVATSPEASYSGIQTFLAEDMVAL